MGGDLKEKKRGLLYLICLHRAVEKPELCMKFCSRLVSSQEVFSGLQDYY